MLFHDLLNELAPPARTFSRASGESPSEFKHAWRARALCETLFMLLEARTRYQWTVEVDHAMVAASMLRVGSAADAVDIVCCAGEPGAVLTWRDDIVDLLLWNILSEARWHRIPGSRTAIHCDCGADMIAFHIRYQGVPPSTVTKVIAVEDRTIDVTTDPYRPDCGITGVHAAQSIGETLGAEIHITSNEDIHDVAIILRRG